MLVARGLCDGYSCRYPASVCNSWYRVISRGYTLQFGTLHFSLLCSNQHNDNRELICFAYGTRATTDGCGTIGLNYGNIS